MRNWDRINKDGGAGIMGHFNLGYHLYRGEHLENFDLELTPPLDMMGIGIVIIFRQENHRKMVVSCDFTGFTLLVMTDIATSFP